MAMTNADCTLYLYDKVTGNYTRHFVQSVYWRENKAGNVLKSGLTTADSTTVYFYGNTYPQNVAKDMLVKGECDFEFDNISAQTVSTSMKSFREQYSFVTVMSIDNYMFGGLPHIEISAK